MPDRNDISGGWAGHLRPRLAALQLDPAREGEIIEELSQHLDERYEELRGAGIDESEARRLAMEELLEPETLAGYMRSLRQANMAPPVALGNPGGSLLRDALQDLRYAGRMLRKQPGFAVTVILTLALGIGANSAMFALVDATLLRPLPFPDPEQLVMVWERSDTSPRSRVSPLNLQDWNTRSRTITGMAGFVPNVGGMVMTGADGIAETVPRQWVTAGIFDTLGVTPIAGRTFLPSDDAAGANVAVLSEQFWRSRFGGDPSIIGREIRLDGDQYTVVGVVSQQAQLIGRSSIWAMIPIQGAPPDARSARFLQVIGRLKPGATVAAAQADMSAVADSLARDFAASNAGRGIQLEPLDDAVIGSELRLTSMLFLGVVGFVLLICCANVANLLLARGTGRARELAIRSAMGAGRSRIIRQLVTESLVLSMMGGLLGLAAGATILSAAPSVTPEGLLPGAVTPAFDWRVIAFCAAASLLVGLLFGIAPALQTTELSPANTFAADNRTTTGRGGAVRGVLVAGEIATAVVLLFGAGLLLRTLIAVDNVDRGYEAEGVLTMIVDPLGARYPTEASLMQFYEQVEQEIRAIPGVSGVAWASTLPLGTSSAGQLSFAIVGDAPREESQPTLADYQIVSANYFETLELPVLAGRAFTDRDTSGKVPVCIVNEAFVRSYLRGRSPIGLRVAMRPAAAPQEAAIVREIVGVARQVKGRPDETQDLIQIYVPMAQDLMDDTFLLVRPESASFEGLAPAVRGAIARVDTEQLVSIRNIQTLEEVASDATARHRFRAVLVMTFAGLALVLAMVGVFGILAYFVQQRVREIGVRRALGATRVDVLRLVAGNAARVIGAGAVVGLAAAALLSRLLATVLFGVEPQDSLTFALVPLVLLVTATLAIAGPAWRATRVDPAIALRGE